MFKRNTTASAKKAEARQQHVAIDQDTCNHCGACVAVCPPDSLFLYEDWLAIDHETCTRCERCVKMCPVHALSMVADPSPQVPL